MEAGDNIDVRVLLPQVRVPTLVVHCDDDRVAVPEHGRVPCGSHCWRPLRVAAEREPSPENEPAWPLFLEELGHFLGWDTVDQSP
jgi:pimeloyl-ACP methyl ester carboxylesterase